MNAPFKAFACLLLGFYFAVAAAGGSIIAGFACLACGWFAGRHTKPPLGAEDGGVDRG